MDLVDTDEVAGVYSVSNDRLARMLVGEQDAQVAQIVSGWPGDDGVAKWVNKG